MIKQLYNYMDENLKQIEEKYKQDETLLRKKIDNEIKSQMSKKLIELDYKQTDNYMEEFLNGYSYFISRTGVYFDDQYRDNVNYYSGFFHNISLLNEDSSLYEDEYIIGIYGDCNTYSCDNRGYKIQDIKLKIITNYLNHSEIIIQYQPYIFWAKFSPVNN